MLSHRHVLAALASLCPLLPAQVPDFYDMDTVRDVYLRFNQSNWWTLLLNNYASRTNIAADMTVDGRTYPNVGVRFRGNTSYTMLPAGSEKKGFNIEVDWLVPSQDVLGYDSLNFNNGFNDPTFLREALAYYVMRRHGVAPKANWIRLWLNGTYWGIYINVQQPNKDMMKEWFRSNDGNRYRCFPVSGGFSNGRCAYTWLGSNVASYLSAYEAKQGDGIDLMNMCNVLNNTPAATLQSVLPAVFNVDSFYRYAAVMNVTTNTDSYLQSGKDHFLYMDEVHGDGTTFPFDLNEALRGSTTLAPDYMTTNVYRPAFTKTLQFPDWMQRYKAHLRAVVDETCNPTHLTPLAQRYHAMLANDVAADTKKLYTTAQFTANLNGPITTTVGSFGGGTITIPGLVPFIAARHAFLNTHAYISAQRPTLSVLAHSPIRPQPNQVITVTVQASTLATAVNLYWRRVGPFQKQPMYDDGQHGDGAANDGVWGAFIPGQQPGAFLDYYVEGLAATGAARYEPHTAELERACPHIQIDWPVVPSPVVINEFVAQNVNGAVDENNQHEDWLELYNTSNQPADVSGKWLSDRLFLPKWQIPAGTIIAPHGVLRIWCDEDGTQGPLHANFKLSASGETIAFFDASAQALHEYIEFGQQYADVSTGRVFDGGLPWVTFPEPSYLATNLPPGCGQRTYGELDPARHGVRLTLSGSLQTGSVMTFTIASGPANGVGLFGMALLPEHVPLSLVGIPGETLLLDPQTVAVPAVALLGAAGAANYQVQIPTVVGLAGTRIYTQALTIDGSVFDTSHAVEARICP